MKSVMVKLPEEEEEECLYTLIVLFCLFKEFDAAFPWHCTARLPQFMIHKPPTESSIGVSVGFRICGWIQGLEQQPEPSSPVQVVTAWSVLH